MVFNISYSSGHCQEIRPALCRLYEWLAMGNIIGQNQGVDERAFNFVKIGVDYDREVSDKVPLPLFIPTFETTYTHCRHPCLKALTQFDARETCNNDAFSRTHLSYPSNRSSEFCRC